MAARDSTRRRKAASRGRSPLPASILALNSLRTRPMLPGRTRRGPTSVGAKADMADPARHPTRRITAILLGAGLVTVSQVEDAVKRQRQTGRRIGETLVELGAVSEVDIGCAVARQLEIPFADLRPDMLDQDLVRSFPEVLLRRVQAVPLLRTGRTLAVALADPTDTEAIAALAEAAGLALEPVAATAIDIVQALDRIFGAAPLPDLGREGGDELAILRSDRPGPRLLQSHLAAAHRAGATEVCFAPHPGELRVQHRIGGRTASVGVEPSAMLEPLLACLKTWGGPTLAGDESFASGTLAFHAGVERLDVRVSLLRVRHGVAVAFALEPDEPIRPLESLGLDPVDLARLRAEIEARAGLVLVTGPPRSGRTTTLASLLHQTPLDRRRVLAVGSASTRWPRADMVVDLPTPGVRLPWGRWAVAHSADVVVVDGALEGDAVIDLTASATAGRLVLASTDWCDSFAMLEHLLARPEGRAALASRLRAVVQQRLVWRAEEEGLANDYAGVAVARRCVGEVLVVGDALREGLRGGASAERLHAIARAEGMTSLAEQVERGRAAGEIGPTEAARGLS